MAFSSHQLENNLENSALHLASQFGSFECAKMLFEKGADRFIRNKKGKTALDIAKELKECEIANLLRY